MFHLKWGERGHKQTNLGYFFFFIGRIYPPSFPISQVQMRTDYSLKIIFSNNLPLQFGGSITSLLRSRTSAALARISCLTCLWGSPCPCLAHRWQVYHCLAYRPPTTENSPDQPLPSSSCGFRMLTFLGQLQPLLCFLQAYHFPCWLPQSQCESSHFLFY